MKHSYAAHPTIYKDVLFRSRLEARWAVFFDVLHTTFKGKNADWFKWAYEPIDLQGWTPDFSVKIPCKSTWAFQGNYLTLFVEVKPDWSMFHNHITSKRDFDIPGTIAHFELGPSHTWWHGQVTASGDGFGDCDLKDHLKWLISPDDLDRAWRACGNAVRYRPPQNKEAA